jgi:hypothetical protein
MGPGSLPIKLIPSLWGNNPVGLVAQEAQARVPTFAPPFGRRAVNLEAD